MKKLYRLLLMAVVFGFFFIMLASMFSDGARPCAQYYNKECKYYNYFTKTCVCLDGNFPLNNSMISSRNDMIIGQNEMLSNRPTNYNFSNLIQSLNTSN